MKRRQRITVLLTDPKARIVRFEIPAGSEVLIVDRRRRPVDVAAALAGPQRRRRRS